MTKSPATTSSALASVNANLATDYYSVSTRVMSEEEVKMGYATISFKAQYLETDGVIISNDSDYINHKQLNACEEVLGRNSRNYVSKIRCLQIQDCQRGFTLPKKIITIRDGEEVENKGRQVIAWKADENPLRDQKPAQMLRKEYVWVTVHIFSQDGQVRIKAFYAPVRERTRSTDYVVERPKKPQTLSPATETSKTK